MCASKVPQYRGLAEALWSFVGSLGELHRDRNCRTLCHTGRGVSKIDTPDTLLVNGYRDTQGAGSRKGSSAIECVSCEHEAVALLSKATEATAEEDPRQRCAQAEGVYLYR